MNSLLSSPRDPLPELQLLENLLHRAGTAVRAECVLRVPLHGRELPVWRLEMGSTDPDAPVAGIFGGIHGMERIGSQVLLAWLESLVSRLAWDVSLQDLLQKVGWR